MLVPIPTIVSVYALSMSFLGKAFLSTTSSSAHPQLNLRCLRLIEPLCAPSFKADPAVDGTRQHNFTIIDFSERTILIGGSAYTGEIKKGIFTVMNYLLPLKGSCTAPPTLEKTVTQRYSSAFPEQARPR